MRLANLALSMAALVALHAGLSAEDVRKDGAVKELKMLAIGNSFSGNALSQFTKIAAAQGVKLEYAHAMIGGCPLEKHVKLAMKFEEDPKNPEGSPYKKDGKSVSLKELLRAGDWQVVSIQQYSAYSFKPQTYRPYAKELCDYIRKYAPKAEIVIHETWPYRPDNANTFKDGFTEKDMYQGLVKSYYGIAKELGIKRIIPVGDAFQLAYEAQPFVVDSSFDPKKAVKPELPKQEPSLHVGWFWKGDKLVYDHGHANLRGCYLAGLVWYGALCGADPTKVAYAPAGISEEDAKFLRGIAKDAVDGKRAADFPKLD